MAKIKTVEDLKKYIGKAYENSNFFDSLFAVKELKQSMDVKTIITKLKKEIRRRKEQERQHKKETDLINKKFSDRNYYLYEDALNYVIHTYRRNDWVFVWLYNKIECVQIERLTKKGYRVWNGYKIGTQHNVKFKDVIC